MEDKQNGTEYDDVITQKTDFSSAALNNDEEDGFMPVIAPDIEAAPNVKFSEEIPKGSTLHDIPTGKFDDIPTGKFDDIPMGKLVEEIPTGKLVEEIPMGKLLIKDTIPYGTIPAPTSSSVNLSPKSNLKQVSDSGKSKKKGKIKSIEDIYKNPKIRWIVLLIGFLLSAVAVCAAIAPVLMLFVPGWAALEGDMPLIQIAKPLNIVAAICGFVGIVFGVAGANTNKFLARLDFFFGIVAFFIGIVMLLFIIPITGLVG